MLLSYIGPSGYSIISTLRGKGDGGIDSYSSIGPGLPEQASLCATGSRLAWVVGQREQAFTEFLPAACR